MVSDPRGVRAAAGPLSDSTGSGVWCPGRPEAVLRGCPLGTLWGPRRATRPQGLRCETWTVNEILLFQKCFLCPSPTGPVMEPGGGRERAGHSAGSLGPEGQGRACGRRPDGAADCRGAGTERVWRSRGPPARPATSALASSGPPQGP